MNGLPVTGPIGGPILIVDDLPENLEVLGRILRDAGHAVRVANSGTVALQYALVEPRPELILLDIMMPGLDGYEVLGRLRENDETRDIPVLFLTALGEVDDIVTGLRLGAVDYITKPVQSELVLARVRTQLDAKRARDWLRDQNAVLEAEVQRRVAEAARIREEADRVQAMLGHQRDLILEGASDGIFGIDVDGIINFANPAAATLLGYGRVELIGRRVHDFLHSVDAGDAHEAPIGVACIGGVEIHGRQERFRRKDGALLVLEYSCRPIVEGGRQEGAVVTLQDRTERQRYLEQIERKSNFDDLTGLPNRNLLYDRLAQAIGRCRDADGSLAVLSLNLDRFKGINDSLGHAAGDQVLIETAARLSACVADTDTLARLDGDEFVLVAEATETDAAARLAQPLLDALQPPFRIGEREFFLSGSIGIAMFPGGGEGHDDGDALLRDATAAMYRAKAAGGKRFSFYAAEMNTRSLDRLDMESALRRAIDRGELVVHYHPQLSLRTGEIIGAEALVRWQHPERGLVMPGQFIGLAEESGLIVPLGESVLRAACAQNKAWQDAGLPPISVAVNMSARQFAAQDVVKLAATILADTGLEPGYLELELTESAVMGDAEAFIRATNELKGLSISLSIDDFGTGFSSLAYLKRFSIDRLKIDQSFVRDITHDPNSAAIALAVISLAHSLKLSAIAEGVETEGQLAFLRRHDCDEMQGYYFSRPLPAEDFAGLLREHRRLQFTESMPLPSRTLLLVDDEASILAALKRLFRREGYTVLSAEGGLEGLELLAGNDVGVVISDARMPGMSGGEFLGKVREMYPDVVRMMLTGYTDLKAVTTAVNAGELFYFLTKPWDDAELLATVRDAFRHYEVRRARSGAALP
jgi:diguanylate cyclase (GGDEF)-like protein/PAS domain S-box-containing protein